MKTMMLCDDQGAIIAIAKIGDLKAAGSKFVSAGMIPSPGQRILEVELSAEEEKQSLRDLHTNYRVDVSAAKLAKRIP